jgi:hypothetical protein
VVATRGGVMLQVGMAAPDQQVSRAWPCAALVESTGAECGSTPSTKWGRICIHLHRRELYLCGTHAAVFSKTSGFAVCRDCANDRTHPHRCAIAIVSLDG